MNQRSKRVVVRTASAFAPDCDKSWLAVDLPSGERVIVSLLQTRGERNSVGVISIDAPRGSVVRRGEELNKVTK